MSESPKSIIQLKYTIHVIHIHKNMLHKSNRQLINQNIKTTKRDVARNLFSSAIPPFAVLVEAEAAPDG